jgi:hypothetical protein
MYVTFSIHHISMSIPLFLHLFHVGYGLKNGGAGVGVGCLGSSPEVRLLALRIIAEGIKHMEAGPLLVELPFIVHTVVPSLSSPVVDIRKAVIFVLVNSFLIIGDALYPFVSDLPAPQKKLLTIYIDKQMQKWK